MKKNARIDGKPKATPQPTIHKKNTPPPLIAQIHQKK